MASGSPATTADGYVLAWAIAVALGCVWLWFGDKKEAR